MTWKQRLNVATTALGLLTVAGGCKLPPIPIPHPSPSPSPSPCEPCADPEPCPPGQHRTVIGVSDCLCDVYGYCEGAPEPSPEPTPVPEPSPEPTPSPEPQPQCPLYGQTSDPETWCGCYADNQYVGDCPEEAKCPPFSTVTGRLYVCLDTKHQISKDGAGNALPVVGGTCTVDTTQRFGGRKPCDPDHPCNGRTDCADPRGQTWTWEATAERCFVQAGPESSGDEGEATGYQLTCKKLKPGRVTWKACIQYDAHDGRGVPYRYDPDPKRCVEGSYDIR